MKEEIYGYEIARLLKENGFYTISEGTLYPLYTRLQKNGYIVSTMKASTLRPARKYYWPTDKGREELNDFVEAWQYLAKNIDGIIQGKIK